MGEKLDLNALQAAVEENQADSVKPTLSQSPLAGKLAHAINQERQMKDGELSRGEQISLLEAEIARLEEEQKQPSRLQIFDAMSPEEQMMELARCIPEIPEAERDPKIWRKELVRASKNSPIPIRILVAQAKIKELRSE